MNDGLLQQSKNTDTLSGGCQIDFLWKEKPSTPSSSRYMYVTLEQGGPVKPGKGGLHKLDHLTPTPAPDVIRLQNGTDTFFVGLAPCFNLLSADDMHSGNVLWGNEISNL